jgi:hypothetical protein
MLDTDGYLRQAASSFRIAGAHLEDAEEQLHDCVRMLEDCAKLVRSIPGDELQLWEQVDGIIRDNETAVTREMETAKP